MGLNPLLHHRLEVEVVGVEVGVWVFVGKRLLRLLGQARSAAADSMAYMVVGEMPTRVEKPVGRVGLQFQACSTS